MQIADYVVMATQAH